MASRAQKILLSIGVALLVLGAALAYVFYPRERLLLEHATSTSYKKYADKYHYTEYEWISKNEILVETCPTAYAPKKEHISFSRLNLTTQKQTPLTKLNRLINAPYSWEYDLSPDGKWLIWNCIKIKYGMYSRPTSTTVAAARLDGSSIRRWKVNAPTTAVWLSDNQHCEVNNWYLEASNSALYKDRIEVTVYDRNPPHSSQTLSFPEPAGYGRNFYWEVYMLAPNRAIGVTALRSSYNYPFRSLPYQDIWDYSLASHQVSSRHYKIVFPPHASSPGWSFSPDGKRIAWQFEITHTSPFAALIHWLFPKRQSKEETTTGFWVSNPDGSDMHEIGHLTAKESNQISPSFKWTPDGKRLSFTYNDRLWTVPVD